MAGALEMVMEGILNFLLLIKNHIFPKNILKRFDADPTYADGDGLGYF